MSSCWWKEPEGAVFPYRVLIEAIEDAPPGNAQDQSSEARHLTVLVEPLAILLPPRFSLRAHRAALRFGGHSAPEPSLLIDRKIVLPSLLAGKHGNLHARDHRTARHGDHLDFLVGGVGQVGELDKGMDPPR